MQDFTESEVLQVIRSWWKREGHKTETGIRLAEIGSQLGHDHMTVVTERKLDRQLQKLRRANKILYAPSGWRPA